MTSYQRRHALQEYGSSPQPVISAITRDACFIASREHVTVATVDHPHQQHLWHKQSQGIISKQLLRLTTRISYLTTHLKEATGARQVSSPGGDLHDHGGPHVEPSHRTRMLL